jgi:xylan 1,4-beta-xylosidase
VDRRIFLQSAVMTGGYAVATKAGYALSPETGGDAGQSIVIKRDAVVGDLPHVWETCVGSDRAAVAFRQQWLQDIERTKKEVGIKYVRFHGLFDDEMGVWPSGAKAPNFLYVDIVFDSLIERGIKPFVELSFMPGALASGTRTAFFYRGNVSTPKDLSQWAELIRAFARHCIDRYGLAEVRTWFFEVWNEANLTFFWTGTEKDYFDFYKQSAVALKSVDQSLRIGGPATARAAWVGDLLDYCAANQAPIDFVSTHVYPDDPQNVLFGEGAAHVPFEDVMPRTLEKIGNQVKTSKFPTLPLYLTEWSSQNPAFIAHTIKGCSGMAEIMSFWTFDNVYEELGVQKGFVNAGYGLLGQRGIPRPSFHTFTLLHKLGDRQLSSDEGPLLATVRRDGSIAVLVWNLIPQPPGVRSASGDPALQTGAQFQTQGSPKTLSLRFEGGKAHGKVQITRVDENSGNFARAYEAIGSPTYPTLPQIEELKRRSQIATPEKMNLNQRGELSITIPGNGIALLEL